MTSSTDVRATDDRATLSASERECLRCIAGHMIPASAELGMPAADDPAIFADMTGSVRRDGQSLRLTLNAVDSAAGGRLCDLPFDRQAALLVRLRSDDPGMFGVVEAVVARAYYRDDRVLNAIGMEARPPFPTGYGIEQGDWSLLDPVRKRAAMYRAAT